MTKEEEITLLKNCLEGRESAFRSLYELYNKQVYHLSLGFFPLMEEAQDATQEIFAKVFAGLRHFRHESSLSTYIYTIALNYCKTELRKQSTVKRSGIFQRIFFSSEEAHQSFVQWEHPGILLERKNQALVLMNAIHELAPAQRDALLLVKYQEFSYKEAAEIMGVSPSALDSLISRAMAKLKKKYRR